MATQMTCPFCNQEFTYEQSGNDKEIAYINQRLMEINYRLLKIKQLPSYLKIPGSAVIYEKRRLIAEIERLTQRLLEIKAHSHESNEQPDNQENPEYQPRHCKPE